MAQSELSLSLANMFLETISPYKDRGFFSRKVSKSFAEIIY
jgi:hypothetical protein